jgi:hypothetical protein
VGCDGLHSSWDHTNNSHIGYYLLVQTSVGGNGVLDSIDTITTRASHEYLEAVTDPICGGWYGGNCFGEEIADKCQDMNQESCQRIDGKTGTKWTVTQVFNRPCGGCSCDVNRIP